MRHLLFKFDYVFDRKKGYQILKKSIIMSYDHLDSRFFKIRKILSIRFDQKNKHVKVFSYSQANFKYS